MRKLIVCVPFLVATCAQAPQYDVVIRHGTVYDGMGTPGRVEDVAVQADRIVALGDLSRAHGRQEADATGLAVAPGFIDMLNHSETALIADGRSQGMIRQGVTLVVFGESSMGPISPQMKRDQQERQGDIKFEIPLEEAIRKLTSLPAATLRIKERGHLATGYFADIVVFDPRTIAEHATYEKPHQYATGMRHVWVNGVQVIKDGEHTGQKPGRIVRGPGWKPRQP
jgi:N-acyl-D-aspartate/D-glutamate deacylase